MESEKIEQIFDIKPVTSLTFTEFIDIIAEVSAYADGIIDAEQIEQLGMLKDMSDMIAEDRAITPDDLAELFSGVASGDMFNDNTLTLLYIMARSNTSDMTGVRIPLYDFFMFLSEDIMQKEAFSSFFDEDVAEQFESAKVTMEEGLGQLVGEDHSRMVIAHNYEVESEAIYAFYDSFNSMLESTLSHEYYLVGMTAMSYEVSQSFEEEYRIISIVTAVAVLLVVWFTFKKFFISLLLIGVIECAVFSMMSVMVLIDLPMYFIPLILVQCILMGSMIDYGILFTTYYMEVRKEFSIEQALPEVMRRSTHSILTSSLLIVLVTLICGSMMTGAVASILTTLGIGSLCAILLILFVLPSLLVIFDKHVIKSTKKA
jgi:predicted RND superfamily exporter protein